MLMSRGLLFLLIYCGVILTDQSCWARNRDEEEGDGTVGGGGGGDGRREGRRDRRRKAERRQKNKEQEKASSSLIEALESHNKYAAANNPPNPPNPMRPTYSNQTTVVGNYYVSQYDHPKPDDIQVGCKELRSKRYISDGFCTSVKPITEVVCTGHCLPIRNLPWYAEFIKVWARTKVLEWRCVEDDIRRKRVNLQCENGETRSYRIKVVKSCKCKRYMKPQNQSLVRLRKGGRAYRKRRRKNRKENESPDYLSNRNGGDL